MPYNTRRKSLSLPSLGIHLPSSSRRSPSLSKPHEDQNDQPSKKVKRSHDSDSSLSPDPQLAQNACSQTHQNRHYQHHRPSARRAAWEHTPPPSPMDAVLPGPPKIDTEGISDDIVVAVIRQLESTQNRPHLVKELAAVLVSLNDTVANSANPAALLSSRLSTYMKRSWSALAPCPIGKELILIHPRKVYYYLTTMARQPLPENSDDLVIPAFEGNQITPSVSSADEDDRVSQDEDDNGLFARQRSSSPEVDLSSPDFEDEPMNLTGRPGPARTTHSFDDHHHPHHPSTLRMMNAHRAVSPPLEGDEKEFTQTASAVRERASEQKASQLELGGARSGISEGLSQLDMDDALSSSASSSRSSPNGGYGYFAHDDDDDDDKNSNNNNNVALEHYKSREQLVENDTDAAACALLGTSPSPSLTSVASSLSSSAPSVAGSDAEEERAPRISLPEDPTVTHVSPLKRSIDMLHSGLSDVDIKMSDLTDHEEKLAIKTAPAPAPALATMDGDHSLDSWRDLQNPETVEVDELDEMFGEI